MFFTEYRNEKDNIVFYLFAGFSQKKIIFADDWVTVGGASSCPDGYAYAYTVAGGDKLCALKSGDKIADGNSCGSNDQCNSGVCKNRMCAPGEGGGGGSGGGGRCTGCSQGDWQPPDDNHDGEWCSNPCNWRGEADCKNERGCSWVPNNPTPTPPTSSKTCSISLSSNSITTAQSVTVNATGTGGTVLEYISRTNTDPISGLGAIVWTDSSGRKYYGISGSSVSGLSAGDYKLWCGVEPDPGKCSGNPFCTYENVGGTLDCSPYGYVSCSSTDNASLTVTAVGTSGIYPNCTNLAGPSTLTVGQAGTYSANFSSPQGNLRGTIDVSQGQQWPFLFTSGEGKGSSGHLSWSWTPTTAGTYDVFCRAWNDGIAECRGKSNYVDGPPRYACAGPNSSMTVTVTAGSSGGPACGSVTIIEAD